MSSNGLVQFVPRGARFQCWPTRTGFEGLEELELVAFGIVFEATLPMLRSSRWPLIAGGYAADNLLEFMLRRSV